MRNPFQGQGRKRLSLTLNMQTGESSCSLSPCNLWNWDRGSLTDPWMKSGASFIQISFFHTIYGVREWGIFLSDADLMRRVIQRMRTRYKFRIERGISPYTAPPLPENLLLQRSPRFKQGSGRSCISESVGEEIFLISNNLRQGGMEYIAWKRESCYHSFLSGLVS